MLGKILLFKFDGWRRKTREDLKLGRNPVTHRGHIEKTETNPYYLRSFTEFDQVCLWQNTLTWIFAAAVFVFCNLFAPSMRNDAMDRREAIATVTAVVPDNGYLLLLLSGGLPVSTCCKYRQQLHSAESESGG